MALSVTQLELRFLSVGLHEGESVSLFYARRKFGHYVAKYSLYIDSLLLYAMPSYSYVAV